MERTRLGLIGCGGMARHIYMPLVAEMDDAEVVACCDLVAEKAAGMAETFGVGRTYLSYPEMLATEVLDAVLVLVEPANFHHVVWNCLGAGLPTYMEKPPGITAFQTAALARRSRDCGKLLQVGFNRRFIPLVREVKRLVEERTTITQVEGAFLKAGSGGFVCDSISAYASDTVHAVDLVRWFAGSEPEAAATVIMGVEEEIDNAWNSVVRFANGVTGIVRANYRVGGRIHEFGIHGPGVSAYVNLGFGGAGCDARILMHQGAPQYSQAACGVDDDGILRLDGLALAGSTENRHYYGFAAEVRHFVDCVRTGRACECTIADAVGSMRFVELLMQSRI